MKFATFAYGDKTSAGVITGDRIVDLGLAFFKWFKKPCRFPDLAAFLAVDGVEKMEGHDPREFRREPTICRRLDEVAIRPPIARPPKIVCVGLNYHDHAAEQNIQPPKSPLLFSKAANIVIGHGDEIRIPNGISDQIDYEVELAVILKKEGFKIARKDFADYIFGYTVMNDVTARDLQFSDKQFFRSKSFDTFAPMGPIVVTADEVDVDNLPVCLRLNGNVMQKSNTKNLVFNVPHLIEHISACFPLEMGDVISTGTPGGVGVYHNPPVFMKPGDTVEAEIEGIGTLINTVR